MLKTQQIADKNPNKHQKLLLISDFQDIYPLVNQFLNEVQEKVHFIHLLMNNEMSKKQDTIQMVSELRKFVSNIVLSYERIYGTTDLIEED